MVWLDTLHASVPAASGTVGCEQWCEHVWNTAVNTKASTPQSPPTTHNPPPYHVWAYFHTTRLNGSRGVKGGLKHSVHTEAFPTGESCVTLHCSWRGWGIGLFDIGQPRGIMPPACGRMQCSRRLHPHRRATGGPWGTWARFGRRRSVCGWGGQARAPQGFGGRQGPQQWPSCTHQVGGWMEQARRPVLVDHWSQGRTSTTDSFECQLNNLPWTLDLELWRQERCSPVGPHRLSYAP